jgi:beta-phosphoglucomutase
MNKKAFIFDLDGVIVDTAKYHFLAWQKDLG